MKRSFYLLVLLVIFSTSESFSQIKRTVSQPSTEAQKQQINVLLDEWHKAAGRADFEAYFSRMTEDAIFIGTDPTENWQKPEFREWARPYFERGRAWNFTALERNVFTTTSCDIAWFDELLQTQMGICRGSGVVVLKDGEWKIQHYVLSIAIPNENVEQVTALKKEFDHDLMLKLKSN